ncbi:hypothetical protein G6F43_010381 [Rhizopus delemar]|nr:hypothetical protein G6F43_010381 [Rhizopus delemar]
MNELRKIKELLEPYDPVDIMNFDETGLYYQQPPRRIICSSESLDGLKKSKTRLTVELLYNLGGTYKGQPIAMAQDKSPECFEARANLLSMTAIRKKHEIEHHYSTDAWMTAYELVATLRNTSEPKSTTVLYVCTSSGYCNMGKESIIRDSITYMAYVAGKLMRGALVSTYDFYCSPSLLAGTQIAPIPSTMPSSPVLSCSKPTAIASSSESSSAVTPGVFEGTVTKQTVMDLFSTISCTTPPNIDLYQKFDNISNKSIRDIVARFIPDATTVPMSTSSQWLNDLPSATRLTSRKRINDKQMLVRNMWFLMPERQDQVAANLFNKHMIRSQKSHKRIQVGTPAFIREYDGYLGGLLPVQQDLCDPICAANSPLLERDLKCSTLSKEICHAHGDMQDLISYAKTAVRPIRLVVIDYAGLTTSPQDLFDFMS